MISYKLQVWTDIDGKTSFKDLYVDVEKILGFYLPDDKDDPIINIFFASQVVSILQEDHIKDYLWNKFAKNVITNNLK